MILELVSGEKTIEIEVPEKASDVRLSKYIDLHQGHQQLIEWLLEQNKEGSLHENRTYYVYRMAKVLSEYFEVDLMDLISLPAGNLLGPDGQLLPEVLKEHLSNYENTDIPSLDGSLLTLYEYINTIVLGYEPKLIGEFTYKGEIWKVPEARVLAYNGIKFPKLTVLQALECMEVERVANSVKDDGSAAFSSYLQRMAILCTKDGEVFDVEGFHDRVAERTAHFQDVTMDIALDVIFFSQSTLNNYLQKIVTDIFSKAPHPDQELAESLEAKQGKYPN